MKKVFLVCGLSALIFTATAAPTAAPANAIGPLLSILLPLAQTVLDKALSGAFSGGQSGPCTRNSGDYLGNDGQCHYGTSSRQSQQYSQKYVLLPNSAWGPLHCNDDPDPDG